MPSEPYVVNVSSVQDFMQCRYRWLCKWVLNRVPRREGPALTTGKLLHLVFEDHFRDGVTLEQAALRRVSEARSAVINDDTLEQWEKDNLYKAIETVVDLAPALPLWQDRYPCEVPVLEVEEPFEIELPGMPGVVFRGRPDRVALMDGAVWHVQNRGLAASMNFGVYARLAKRHYHEHLYAEHLSRKYADLAPYGGTLFNLVRKLKFRTNVGRRNEKTKTAEEMFWQHPMSVRLGPRGHWDVMQSLFEHVHEMQRVEELWELERRYPAPNEKMNGGMNGSTEDPYFKVLIGETDLSDDRYFKTREDLYAHADADAGAE